MKYPNSFYVTILLKQLILVLYVISMFSCIPPSDGLEEKEREDKIQYSIKRYDSLFDTALINNFKLGECLVYSTQTAYCFYHHTTKNSQLMVHEVVDDNHVSMAKIIVEKRKGTITPGVFYHGGFTFKNYEYTFMIDEDSMADKLSLGYDGVIRMDTTIGDSIRYISVQSECVSINYDSDLRNFVLSPVVTNKAPTPLNCSICFYRKGRSVFIILYFSESEIDNWELLRMLK